MNVVYNKRDYILPFKKYLNKPKKSVSFEQKVEYEYTYGKDAYDRKPIDSVEQVTLRELYELTLSRIEARKSNVYYSKNPNPLDNNVADIIQCINDDKLPEEKKVDIIAKVEQEKINNMEIDELELRSKNTKKIKLDFNKTISSDEEKEEIENGKENEEEKENESPNEGNKNENENKEKDRVILNNNALMEEPDEMENLNNNNNNNGNNSSSPESTEIETKKEIDNSIPYTSTLKVCTDINKEEEEEFKEQLGEQMTDIVKKIISPRDTFYNKNIMKGKPVRRVKVKTGVEMEALGNNTKIETDTETENENKNNAKTEIEIKTEINNNSNDNDDDDDDIPTPLQNDSPEELSIFDHPEDSSDNGNNFNNFNNNNNNNNNNDINDYSITSPISPIQPIFHPNGDINYKNLPEKFVSPRRIDSINRKVPNFIGQFDLAHYKPPIKSLAEINDPNYEENVGFEPIPYGSNVVYDEPEVISPTLDHAIPEYHRPMMGYRNNLMNIASYGSNYENYNNNYYNYDYSYYNNSNNGNGNESRIENLPPKTSPEMDKKVKDKKSNRKSLNIFHILKKSKSAEAMKGNKSRMSFFKPASKMNSMPIENSNTIYNKPQSPIAQAQNPINYKNSIRNNRVSIFNNNFQELSDINSDNNPENKNMSQYALKSLKLRQSDSSLHVNTNNFHLGVAQSPNRLKSVSPISVNSNNSSQSIQSSHSGSNNSRYQNQNQTTRNNSTSTVNTNSTTSPDINLISHSKSSKSIKSTKSNSSIYVPNIPLD